MSLRQNIHLPYYFTIKNTYSSHLLILTLYVKILGKDLSYSNISGVRTMGQVISILDIKTGELISFDKIFGKIDA